MPQLPGACERCRHWADRAYYPLRGHRVLVCSACWHEIFVESALDAAHAALLHPWPAAQFRAIAKELVGDLGDCIENGLDVDANALVQRVRQEWYPQAKAALEAIQTEPLFLVCENPNCALTRYNNGLPCVCQEIPKGGHR